MKALEPVLGNDEQSELGEGPVWDETRERLLWVDIRRGVVYSGTLEPAGTVSIQERIRFEQTVGAVAVAENGDMLVAGATQLLVRHPDGSVDAGPRILDAKVDRRLNDGKVDPSGRFVVGSLSLGAPSETETLVQVGVDGAVAIVDDDLTLSNGLAWTPSGKFYSIDTMRQLVYVRDYADDGSLGEREVFLTVADGYPDGMCLDAEEHLWIAIWGLGRVNRYSPAGELVQSVAIPAPHVSSVAFAGPDLATLVVTTATQDLSEEELARFPHSGHLFTIDVGVRGLPQRPWTPFVLAETYEEHLS